MDRQEAWSVKAEDRKPEPFPLRTTDPGEDLTYIDPHVRANAEKNGILHASEEVISERHALANAVHGELQQAGLPAYVEFSSSPSEGQPGARVSVNTMDGPAGGVHVGWNPGESLTGAVLGLMEPERLDLPAPVIEYSNRVSSLMDETIKNALALSGFRTRDAGEVNDLDSGIQVVGRQPRQWFIVHILTEGVLGLITAIRSYGSSGDAPDAHAGITAEEKARLSGRGIRIVQEGLHSLTDDDRQELASVFRRLAGAMHSQDMASRGFWAADRSLLELADELCLLPDTPLATAGSSMTSTQVLAAAYLALLGSIKLTEHSIDEGDATAITRTWTGTLLRRLDQAPLEDRQELSRLLDQAAREETDHAHKAFASGFAETIAQTEESN
ncbi:hypothetical protein [Streptomyces sp. ERV7]|uniref:hypothetical protein n=1 Tax=Streptomyces sp. ERV7 TaxID=1322334 RepID=UPI00131DE738|nr:hypothetical protein [Streptomyces sp. ERV7]